MYKSIFQTFAVLLFLVLSVFSCKDSAKEPGTNPNSLGNFYEVENTIPYPELFKTAAEDPTQPNIMKGFDELMKQINLNKNSDKRKALFSDGIKYSRQFKKRSLLANFYAPMLKEFPDENSKDYIFDLGKIMKESRQESASDVLFSNFIDLYPSDPRVKEAKSYIRKDFKDIDSFLKSKADEAFKREPGTKIDKKVVQAYVNACEAYAMSNLNGKMTPSYLYKGSELARSIKSFEKVMSLYNWIMDKYPDYEKTPTVHFLKGFILENEVKLKDEAKKVYESFIVKYPNHELADDVKFLINNIGKSNDEILELLNKNKEKQVKK